MSKHVFSFGTPEPIFNFWDYLETYDNGTFYQIPINLNDLSNLLRAGSYHASCLQTKRNILSLTFLESDILSFAEFDKFIDAFLTFGNGYLEVVRDRLGRVSSLKSLPAKYMRRASNLKDFILLNGNNIEHTTYKADRVLHLMNADLNQEVYGVPYYLGAFHSVKLNESATLFRRRYYDNGSHAGFILYIDDSAINEKDFDKLTQTLRETKGGGNFNNILLRTKKSQNAEKNIKLIPISEVAAKDEFLNIKKVTRDDILAAHRVPPQLMGIIPDNAGGFGDMEKAAKIFALNEIKPLQRMMTALNSKLGVEAFCFGDYKVNEEE